MSKDEMLYFLDNLEKFVQFNFSGKCENSGTELTITDFGDKFHKIENQLHFKRKRAEKYLKFITDDN